MASGFSKKASKKKTSYKGIPGKRKSVKKVSKEGSKKEQRTNPNISRKGSEDYQQRKKYNRGGRIEAYTFGEALKDPSYK